MLVNELLGIKYSILQGVMVNIVTPELAAAVPNCGVLGIIATGAMDEYQTREVIRTCKQLTDKPFGVNIMLTNPHTQAIMQVTCEKRVAVVTTGAGSPGPYIPVLKESGCKVIPVVASVALARRLEKSGVDAVIAEGGEFGGHVEETTTMSLVPQVADAVSTPVLTAGGAASGRQLNAVLCLGAVGMQAGICLLLAEECPIHENCKRAVMKAKDMDFVIIGRNTGTPVRILKSQMALQYLKLEQSGADEEEMEKLTLGGLRRAIREGDTRRGPVMMGQVAGMCRDIRPSQGILDSLTRESEEEAVALQQAVKELCYE